MYSISSSRYLKNLLETEVIESIWSQDPEQDHFYALSSLNNEFKVLKVQIPSGNILKKLKWNKNIDVPEKTLKILPDFKVQDDDKVSSSSKKLVLEGNVCLKNHSSKCFL